MVESLDGSVELIDHHGVEWSRVRHVAYLLHQVFRYEYPGPIEDLRQRLVVFPAELHGGQRLVGRHLQVNGGQATLHEEFDQFGNRVCQLYIPRIERAIEFEVRFLVERKTGSGGVAVGDLREPAYRKPSLLTTPDDRLCAAAAALEAAGDGLGLADRVCAWVHQQVAYRAAVTDVSTTAAEALALGQGVCQDHAHVMLALCRLLGLPARYVSGHLLGEGATHAWVEVLAPNSTRDGRLAVQAFDPSHGRRCRPDYITVAVGRDYADVAPTSGTYSAPYSGNLTSYKRAGITQLDYAA
jgi:transglutaminase-like putative cysteine protease